MKQTRFQTNLFFSLLSVVFQFLQAMLVTSLIQRNVGVEAYGYVSVIVSLVNIAGIMTVAVTSTCSRNMVIRLKNNDKNGVQKYFNTVLISLLVMSTVCLIFLVLASVFIDKIMVVSPIYLQQIRILLWIVGIDFIIQLIQVPYMAIIYYEDRLNYYYIATMLCNLTKILFVVIFFWLWKPVIWIAHAGGLCVNIVSLSFFSRYTYGRIPYLTLHWKYFDKKCLKEIVSVGTWVSVSKLAATLLSSCSTYLVNILVGVLVAGIYASVMQVQSILSFVTISVVNVFLPRMYELFAHNQEIQLKKYVVGNYSVLLSLLGIVSGGLIVYGNEFMGLWLSHEYLSHEILIFVSVCYLQIAYSSELLNQFLITKNKTKMPAIVSVISGLANVILSVVLVCGFDLGIFGIAIAQLIVSVCRSGIWFPIYTVQSSNISFGEVLLCQIKGIVVTVITVLIGNLVALIVVPKGWLSLGAACIVTGMLALVVTIIINPQLLTSIKESFRKRSITNV